MFYVGAFTQGAGAGENLIEVPGEEGGVFWPHPEHERGAFAGNWCRGCAAKFAVDLETMITGSFRRAL